MKRNRKNRMNNKRANGDSGKGGKSANPSKSMALSFLEMNGQSGPSSNENSPMKMLLKNTAPEFSGMEMDEVVSLRLCQKSRLWVIFRVLKSILAYFLRP